MRDGDAFVCGVLPLPPAAHTAGGARERGLPQPPAQHGMPQGPKSVTAGEMLQYIVGCIKFCRMKNLYRGNHCMIVGIAHMRLDTRELMV